jgi:hypothetical protein
MTTAIPLFLILLKMNPEEEQQPTNNIMGALPNGSTWNDISLDETVDMDLSDDMFMFDTLDYGDDDSSGVEKSPVDPNMTSLSGDASSWHNMDTLMNGNFARTVSKDWDTSDEEKKKKKHVEEAEMEEELEATNMKLASTKFKLYDTKAELERTQVHVPIEEIGELSGICKGENDVPALAATEDRKENVDADSLLLNEAKNAHQTTTTANIPPHSPFPIKMTNHDNNWLQHFQALVVCTYHYICFIQCTPQPLCSSLSLFPNPNSLSLSLFWFFSFRPSRKNTVSHKFR